MVMRKEKIKRTNVHASGAAHRRTTDSGRNNMTTSQKINGGRKLEQKWRVTTISYSFICRQEPIIYKAVGVILAAGCVRNLTVRTPDACEINLIL
jgi:hypothetical protein